MCNSCTEQPSLQLIDSRTLDFPSASGIEYYGGNLYLVGDNAPYFLVLSSSFQPIRKIAYWPDTTAVISKEEKPDIESALLTEKNGKPMLLGIGSLSSENRWPVFEWTIGEDSVKKKRLFPKAISFKGIKEINIEGSTRFREGLLFCNRGNLTTKMNHLIFWNGPEGFSVKEMRLPQTKSTAGLSGLYYIREKDLLLFTASEEATFNATEDGKIGESYLGWIHDFSARSKEAVLQASGLLQLSAFAPEFKGQKIEGVCAEIVKDNRYRLYLVADNDNGKSGIFKVDLRL